MGGLDQIQIGKQWIDLIGSITTEIHIRSNIFSTQFDVIYAISNFLHVKPNIYFKFVFSIYNDVYVFLHAEWIQIYMKSNISVISHTFLLLCIASFYLLSSIC